MFEKSNKGFSFTHFTCFFISTIPFLPVHKEITNTICNHFPLPLSLPPSWKPSWPHLHSSKWSPCVYSCPLMVSSAGVVFKCTCSSGGSWCSLAGKLVWPKSIEGKARLGETCLLPTVRLLPSCYSLPLSLQTQGTPTSLPTLSGRNSTGESPSDWQVPDQLSTRNRGAREQSFSL